MEGLIRQLLTMPQLRELTAGIDGREKHSMITGLSPVQRASVAAAAAEQAYAKKSFCKIFYPLRVDYYVKHYGAGHDVIGVRRAVF